MNRGLVDTHAHLDGPEYRDDLGDVLGRAAEADVRAVVACAQDETSSRTVLELAANNPMIAPAVGVHPHEAKSAGDLEWLPELGRDDGVVALGEIGLDYHYNFSPPDAQRDVFARQLELAATLGLPAIIHCREAEDDVAALLRKHRAGDLPAVMHCFLGSYEIGAQFIDEFDVYLGIGGAVTFKNAKALQEAAERLPLERLVLETDCPFMTPVPHRGKRNEPAYVALTCLRLAELRGISEDEVAKATTTNAARLFPKIASKLKGT